MPYLLIILKRSWPIQTVLKQGSGNSIRWLVSEMLSFLCEYKMFKQFLLNKAGFQWPDNLMVSHHWTCIHGRQSTIHRSRGQKPKRATKVTLTSHQPFENGDGKAFCDNAVQPRVISWACGACIALDVWYRFVWRTTGRVMLRNYLFCVT